MRYFKILNYVLMEKNNDVMFVLDSAYLKKTKEDKSKKISLYNDKYCFYFENKEHIQQIKDKFQNGRKSDLLILINKNGKTSVLNCFINI